MPVVTGVTPEEAEKAMRAAIEAHCLIAFACGCRVAIQFLSATNVGQCVITYNFVVLSPGERAPDGRGWEVYEQRDGRAVGRSV